MGQKDIAEKMLADYNDVFADIVNVLLFNGEHIVDDMFLENTKDKQQIKIAGKIHEEERDVAKVFKNHKIRIALMGFEHQTEVDKDEPFRVIAYDGVSYKAQLQAGKERYPVVTMVLYFGLKRWDKAKSLYEALVIPDNWSKNIDFISVKSQNINLAELT